MIATISVDRVLRLHELATGAARELAGSDVASRLIFTPDGTGVITAELGGIRAWTLATGTSRVLPFPSHRYISVAVSPDGATIAAAGFEGPIHLLDVASEQVATLSGHDALVTCMDFSPDGQHLVSTAMDHTTRLWQLPTRRDRIVGRVTGKAAFPKIAPDGGEIAVGTQDGTIARWTTSTGAATPLTGHTRAVFDVAYSPDGRVLASQSQDLTVRIWDRRTGASREVARTAPWVDFGHLMFSPDGRRLAASLDLETLAVIDVATGERVCTFGGGGFNLAHAFHPDGHAIAFTGDHRVMLGDLATCQARTLYAHDPSKSAYQIVFSRDGRYLASASDDATVGLHDFVTGTDRRLRGHDVDVTSVAFTPDGKTLASGGGDRTVRLWDVQTGAARVLHGPATMVVGVGFSPDGRVLAASGLDAVVYLWDVASGAGSLLVGHRERVVGLGFAPDGRELISGSYDGTVRAWPADPLQDMPVEPGALKARLDMLTSARIDAENRATSRSP